MLKILLIMIELLKPIRVVFFASLEGTVQKFILTLTNTEHEHLLYWQPPAHSKQGINFFKLRTYNTVSV